MKKISIILIFTALMFGCEKADRFTQFDMEYNETAVVPSSTGINLPFNIFTPDIESNSESTFAVNDTRKDLIESISIKTLDLSVTSPSGEDFSFLKSIEIYISADGLSETKVAWKDNIPSDATTLSLDLTNNDLKEYVKADQFTLRLNTVTDELLATDYTIAIHTVFFVDAKILGV